METTAHKKDPVNRQVLRSLLLGVAIWFVHLNTVYPLTSLECKWGWFDFSVGSLSGVQVVQTVINTIALLAMAVLIFLPWRAWRRFQSEPPPENPHMLKDTEKDRRALSAFIVMSLNSFFFLYLLASYVIIFSIRPCT